MKIAYCIKVLSYPHLDIVNCMCKLLTLVRNDILWCHFHLNTQLPVHFTCRSSPTNLENSVFDKSFILPKMDFVLEHIAKKFNIKKKIDGYVNNYRMSGIDNLFYFLAASI